MTGKVIRTSGGRIVSSTPRSNLVTDTKFVESSVEPKSVGPPANSIVGICSPAPKVTPSPSYVAQGGMLLNNIKFNKKGRARQEEKQQNDGGRIKFVF